ncbi:MAG: tRNA pseudouridine(38-40) synthase TruA [Candidatus Omnitrophica bacterium]|nr:tRNA pseudouridine(38-40) synthase TruA [Candidatus Omnitrophota bacterium]
MRNIKLVIAYNGANYCGWQSQVAGGRKKSIQQVVEKVLKKILGEQVNAAASGRTDSGAHALAQVVNFKTSSSIPPAKIKKALNFWLPEDIVCLDAKEAGAGFHARFKTTSKTYRYLIVNSKSRPLFLGRLTHFVPYELDIDLMRDELNSLRGRRDFASFCSSGSTAKDTVRTVKRVDLRVIRSGAIQSFLTPGSALIAIEIEADGFLNHMVRNIVGTLVDIGRGRFKKGSMRGILSHKDRKRAGYTAPAKGLYLSRVVYP